MRVNEIQPVGVWDVKDAEWQTRRALKSDWLREHGIPVNQAYRAEFYWNDPPFVRIFCFHLDEDGRKHWDHGHDPQTCKLDHACGACTEPPHDVPLSELPPRELLAAGR